MSVPTATKLVPCTAIFVCLLVAPPLLHWMTSLTSSDQQVMVDLRGMELPALYRHAVRNPDGSIDLTINIPASANLLKRLMDKQEQLKYNLTVQKRLRYNNTGPEGILLPNLPATTRKTYYPVTMDSPYILNSPDLCRGLDPLHVLIVVHTATNNFQRRRLIRETWAGKNLITSRNVRLLFLLGLTTHNQTQTLIENERLVYGDLVQGRFKDSYHNLTHKGVMAYRWIQQYCPHARLILKVDDDIFINPFLLHHIYYPRYTQSNRTIACHVRPKNTSPIVRGPKGKWKVEDYEFRGYKHYPFDYCNGYMVIITRDIIKAMYHAAYTTPFFWIDDVYLYGMLPYKVSKVHHDNIKTNLTLASKFGLECYQKLNCTLLAVNAGKEDTFHELWKLTLTQVQKDATLNKYINPAYLVS